jgi:hypothetical protein
MVQAFWRNAPSLIELTRTPGATLLAGASQLLCAFINTAALARCPDAKNEISRFNLKTAVREVSNFSNAL